MKAPRENPFFALLRAVRAETTEDWTYLYVLGVVAALVGVALFTYWLHAR